MLALTFDSTLDLVRSGARHGVGCFETVRVQDGAPRWLALHLERLAGGCAFLGLDAPPPEREVAGALASRLAALPRGVLHLVAVDDRLIAGWGELPPLAPPGPGALVHRQAQHDRMREAARIAVAERVTRFSRSPLARWKTLSYAENRLLQREAEARGLFDVVARNERGRLADGGRTNLFLVVDGRTVTPPVEDGALPGIARRVLLERGLAEERSVGPEDLEAAEGVFVANALRGAIAVRLDGGGRVAACAAALA